MKSPFKGTYLFLFLLKEPLSITTKGGKQFFLPRGRYVYVGSAFGGGGVQSRLKRHLKREKSLHWHLDYVTTTDKWEFLGFIVFEGKKMECRLAQKLEKLGFKPIEGFGSSDCSCKGHLFLILQK